MVVLIVGAGLSGATIAENYARHNIKSIVIDKRSHIAGNIYDESIKDIRVNKYGPHLFHTNDTGVWQYIQQFANWKRWDHTVLADISGSYVPVPVNITTVNTICNTNIQTTEEMKEWLENIQYKGKINNSKDVALSRVGNDLYEKLFRPYTIKQWGKEPELLDSSVLARIPVRYDFDNRYFTDRYQALPEKGYTDMIQNMLNHPLIEVRLNYPWETAKDEIKWDELIFTGPIDSYFNQSDLPKLEYRSLNFEWNVLEQEGYYQPVAQVNFPRLDVPYTRCIEYKHFLHQKSKYTVICKETSSSIGEPYYPVPSKTNQDLYNKYKELTLKEENVHFIGRLATYKYFNMDQAIRNAIDYFNNVLKPSVKKVPTEIVSLGGVGGCVLADVLKQLGRKRYTYDWLISSMTFIFKSFNKIDEFFKFEDEYVYNNKLLTKNKDAIMLHDFCNFSVEKNNVIEKYSRRFERLNAIINTNINMLFVRIMDTPTNIVITEPNTYIREYDEINQWTEFMKQMRDKTHLLLFHMEPSWEPYKSLNNITVIYLKEYTREFIQTEIISYLDKNNSILYEYT